MVKVKYLLPSNSLKSFTYYHIFDPLYVPYSSLIRSRSHQAQSNDIYIPL